MSFKRTIVIALLFLAFGGFYYFYEVKGKPAREEKKLRENAVFSFKEEEVESLKLVRGEDNFTFVKRDDSWYLKDPVEARADKQTLVSLARAVSTASKKETVEENSQDLVKYGLDKPRYEILLGDGKKQETLQLGEMTVDSQSFYAKRKDSNLVFLLDTGFKYNLDRELFDYRDRSIVNIPLQDIQKVVYHRDKDTFIFDKQDDSWTTGTSSIPRPGNSEISSFVMQLASLKTLDFLPNDPKSQDNSGISRSNFWIEIYGKDPVRPLLMRIGRTDEKADKLYLAVDGANEMYALAKAEASKLEKKSEDFLDRKLIKTHSNSIYTLTARIDGKEYVFKKEKVDKSKDKSKKHVELDDTDVKFTWKLVSPGEKSLEFETMDTLVVVPLVNLYVTGAEKFSGDLKQYGLDKPVYYFKGQNDEDKVLFEVEVGKSSPGSGEFGKFVYIRNIDESVICTTNELPLTKMVRETRKLGTLPKASPSPSPTSTKANTPVR